MSSLMDTKGLPDAKVGTLQKLSGITETWYWG